MVRLRFNFYGFFSDHDDSHDLTECELERLGPDTSTKLGPIPKGSGGFWYFIPSDLPEKPCRDLN